MPDAPMTFTKRPGSRDGVEIRFDNCRRSFVCFIKLRSINRHADKKIVCEDIFQIALGVNVRKR